MKIHLPKTAWIHNIDPFLRGFDPTDPSILEITADKKWISVHPVAIAMTAALGKKVGVNNIKCEKFEAKSSPYFERMGLFKILGLISGIEIHEHEESGRFIPVTQIRTAAEQSKFITDIVPLLHLEKKHQVDTIVYILGEILRNVLEHSDEPNGAFVCAQYYKEKNTIRIGIADTGIGIKASITASHKASDHIEAIKLALWPGVTGTTRRIGGNDQNAGLGLFFTKSIARVNRDYFMMYSGNAMYKLHLAPQRKKIKIHSDPFKDKHAKTDQLPFWRGTVVAIDITLDQTEEFETLMKMILEVLSKAISEKNREKYRSPNFV